MRVYLSINFNEIYKVHNSARNNPTYFISFRIYPAYIVAFLVVYLINKPQPYSYKLMKQHTENCDRYWWRNLLFINNFFDPFKAVSKVLRIMFDLENKLNSLLKKKKKLNLGKRTWKLAALEKQPLLAYIFIRNFSIHE